MIVYLDLKIAHLQQESKAQGSVRERMKTLEAK